MKALVKPGAAHTKGCVGNWLVQKLSPKAARRKANKSIVHQTKRTSRSSASTGLQQRKVPATPETGGVAPYGLITGPDKDWEKRYE